MKRRATAGQRKALALRHPGAAVKRGQVVEIGKARTPQSLLYTTQMPTISEAPIGARVIDSCGASVVALSFRGMFLGFFKTR